MRKHFIITSAISMAALFVAGAYADQVAAAGKLAELSKVSVESKAAVSSAAKSGDVDALAEATKRSDKVDEAVAEGQEAYSAMEQAIEAGDPDAADAAEQSLDVAVDKANNAKDGNYSEEAPRQQAPKSSKKTGGPGEPGDVPNIFAKPSDTAVQATVKASRNASDQATGAFGSRVPFFDREPTPQ
jgi:FtsZ-interacting cell division protein ZipA